MKGEIMAIVKIVSAFRGFVAAGFAFGGGGLEVAAPKESFNEAWVDAQDLLKKSAFGDSVAGVEEVSCEYIHDAGGWRLGEVVQPEKTAPATTAPSDGPDPARCSCGAGFDWNEKCPGCGCFHHPFIAGMMF